MAPRRFFLGTDRPALVSAAGYLREAAGADGILDLSQFVVVLPGRRAGRRLLELLADETAPGCSDVRPPRVLTFDRLPELLYPLQRPAADELTQLLVWWGTLTQFSAEQLRPAIPHPPRRDSLNAWIALSETLKRQHCELAAEGLDFDDVVSALETAEEQSEADRWKCLAKVQRECLSRLDQLNLWDLQTARIQAVRRKECRTTQKIILLATTDMSAVVRQMLSLVSDQVCVLIHADVSEADLYDDYGCVLAQKWAERPIRIPDAAIRIKDTPEDQVECVLQELNRIQPFRPDQVTLGTADETLHPILIQRLAAAGVPVNRPVGNLISKSRPWRLLDALIRHIGSARDELPPGFSTLNDLVRHPDVYQWITDRIRISSGAAASCDAESPWLGELDAYCSEHLQAAPDVILGTGHRRLVVEQICGCVELLLQALLEPLTDSSLKATAVAVQGELDFEQQGPSPRKSMRRLTETRRTLASWSQGVLRLLRLLYTARGDEKATDVMPVIAGTAECLSAFRGISDRLLAIPEAVQPRCTIVQALQFVLAQCEARRQQAQWCEQGLEMMGWLELPLDDAPNLILTGFNDGSVPTTTGADPFLPNRIRQRLGLSDNLRRYARDACALESLLHGRNSTLIMGRTDSDGNPIPPSRLWFACAPSTAVRRIQQFYEQEPGAPVSGNQAISEAPLVPSRTGFSISPPDRLGDAPKLLVVTAFRDYLQCPFRYYLRRELRLKSVQDDVRELDAAAFGNLIHDVLRAFGESPVRAATEQDSISEFLLQELQRRSLRLFGRSRSATVSVQLRMIETRLKAFAAWQSAHASEGWRIVMTEKKVRSSGFRDIKGRELTLEGRIDRIDRHGATDEFLVLDYKTGEQPASPDSSHRTKGRWKDLQLPLYRLLVRALEIRGTVRLGYVQLPGDLNSTGLAMADWSDADLDAAEEFARVTAADILDLRMDRIDSLTDLRYSDLSRICLDTVADRVPDWISEWSGRTSL